MGVSTGTRCSTRADTVSQNQMHILLNASCSHRYQSFRNALENFESGSRRFTTIMLAPRDVHAMMYTVITIHERLRDEVFFMIERSTRSNDFTVHPCNLKCPNKMEHFYERLLFVHPRSFILFCLLPCNYKSVRRKRC